MSSLLELLPACLGKIGCSLMPFGDRLCRYSGDAKVVIQGVDKQLKRLETAKKDLREVVSLSDERSVKKFIEKYGSDWDEILEKGQEQVAKLGEQSATLAAKNKQLMKEILLEKDRTNRYRSHAEHQRMASLNLQRYTKVWLRNVRDGMLDVC